MARTTTVNYEKIEKMNKQKFYNNNWFVWICFFSLWLLLPYLLSFIKNYF